LNESYEAGQLTLALDMMTTGKQLSHLNEAWRVVKSVAALLACHFSFKFNGLLN
jgi:hypothetical protein